MLTGNADGEAFAVGKNIIVPGLIQLLVDRNLEQHWPAKTDCRASDDINGHELVGVVDIEQSLPVPRPDRMVSATPGDLVVRI